MGRRRNIRAYGHQPYLMKPNSIYVYVSTSYILTGIDEEVLNNVSESDINCNF